MFTFPGDEKQSEISQHSDSLNFFFKILINHEAFWQPPQILRNPCLISHSLSAYSVWSLTAWLERTAGTGGPQGPPMGGGQQLALRVCADIPSVSARGALMTNVLTWV